MQAIHKGQSAVAQAVSALSATHGFTAENWEDAQIEGRYTASCTRVQPEHQERATALLAMLEAAMDRAPYSDETEALLAEWNAIPRYEVWTEEFDNLVTDVGKRFILDTVLAGSAYTVTGPFMGLINGSASSAAAADTMASHAAWLEVGGTNAPAYTGNRLTVSWNAASGTSKVNSGTLTFTFTSGGTVGGCFLALGSGAVNTKDSTAGTLYSAGAFTGGSKTVANTDTLTVTYTASA